jgi:type II secretion system protein G
MKIQPLNRNRIIRRHSRGFTLVEMLLVLVILATLAAIVYPKVMGRSEQARVTAAQTQIANFKTALDSFEVDNGYYPKGKNGLNDLIVQPRDAVSWTPGAVNTSTIAPANTTRVPTTSARKGRREPIRPSETGRPSAAEISVQTRSARA